MLIQAASTRVYFCCQTLITSICACQWQKQALLVDVFWHVQLPPRIRLHCSPFHGCWLKRSRSLPHQFLKRFYPLVNQNDGKKRSRLKNTGISCAEKGVIGWLTGVSANHNYCQYGRCHFLMSSQRLLTFIKKQDLMSSGIIAHKNTQERISIVFFSL